MSTVAEKTKVELVEDLLATPEGKNLTPAEIAERVGAHVGHVQRIMRARASKPPAVVMLKINDLVTDYGTQMRPGTEESREIEFEGLYRDGIEVDPIEVYDTPTGLLPTDGWHRYGGRVRAGFTNIPAIVIRGTEAEAIEAAARANAKGSLPRCNITKTNAVLALIDLHDDRLGIELLAEKASVSANFAKKVHADWKVREKRKAETNGTPFEEPDKKLGKDGKMYPAVKPVSTVSGSSRDEPEPDASEFYDDDEEVGQPPSNGVAHTNGHMPAKEPCQAEKDEQWLSELGREEGKTPIRDRLTPENRAVFDADALAYKKLHIDSDVFKTFAEQANKVMKIKKVGGGKGNYARLTSWFLRLKHPKDWIICYTCKGIGCDAKGCNHLGYVVE